MTLRWFAFTTGPNLERRALEELAPFAAEVRLPVGLRETNPVRRGWDARGSAPRKRAWPLMVGYAFAGFDARARLIEILERMAQAREDGRRQALRRVVATAAGVPLELRADADGRAWYEAMDYSTVELPGGEARPLGWGEGDTVKLTGGAFAGMTAPVSRVAGERASVVVELFQRLLDVDVSVRDAVLHEKRWPIDKGEEVMVLDGPFADFTGPVIAGRVSNGVNTAQIELDILGRKTLVDIAFSQIRRVRSRGVPVDSLGRRTS